MTDLQLNGVDITVATPSEAQELGLECSLDLGNGLVLVAPPVVTVKTLIILAGHDWDKIDAAVPQDWADQRGYDPQDWVWSYEHQSIFGEPLSLLWKVKREAAQQILALLLSSTTAVDGGESHHDDAR